MNEEHRAVHLLIRMNEKYAAWILFVFLILLCVVSKLPIFANSRKRMPNILALNANMKSHFEGKPILARFDLARVLVAFTVGPSVGPSVGHRLLFRRF